MESVSVSERLPGKDSPPAARRYRVVDWASFALLVLALSYWATFVLFVLPQVLRGQGQDFTSYYAAALTLRLHPAANVYDLPLLRQVVAGSGCVDAFDAYRYPQALAILFEPFTLLPCNLAAGLWFFFNVALWLGSIFLLARWLPSLLPAASAQWNRWLRRGILILYLISVPLIESLILGQINFIVLLALILVPWLLQRGKPVAAGGVLGLIAMIKVLPAFLLLYYLAQKRWRVLLGAGLGGALLLGLMLLTVGVSGTLAGFTYVFSLELGFNPPHNEALAQLPRWFALASGGQPDQLTRWLSLLLQGMVALAFVAGVSAIRRRRARPAALQVALPDQAALEDALGYGWAICTMLLLAPLVWFHYNGWLLLPLLCGLAVALRCLPLAQRQTWLILFLLAAAAVLTAFPLPFDVDNLGIHARTPTLLGAPLWLILLHMRPLGTLLLWSVLYRLWWRLSRTAPLLAPASISGYTPAAPLRSAHRGGE